MSLAPGSRLGPYEIVERLGSGGMGEVFRARDTRLDRDVAIKVLSHDLAARPDLFQRFEREARAVSALNHSNICSLFDIGTHEGTPYLVMECVQGETLEKRIARGPIPLAEAWPILLQIGAALQEAHSRGITHRDLKPANIMISAGGAVKLLDFGLAKFPAQAVAVASGATSLPTMAMASLTAEGTIVGTFQYMAPEQLEGKEADARTDIFAFGAVIYEMLTGRKAFSGETHASLIGAIMAGEPPRISALVPVSPPALDRLVQKCLAKNPADRWHSVRELVNEIRWISESSSQANLAPAVVARPNRRLWMAAAVASWIALAATLAAWGWTAGWFRAKPTAVGAVRFPLPLPEGTILPFSSFSPATPQSVPSPDGRHIVFLAVDKDVSHLWVRPLDSPLPQRLDKTEGARYPFWSPDGQFIAFFADQHLKRISVSGGSLQTICDVETIGDGGTWNRDGAILFSAGGAIMRIPAAGGIPSPVTTLDTKAGESKHTWPQVLPDGQHFLYFAHSPDRQKRAIYVQKVGSAERKLILKNDLPGAYASGHLLFVRDDTLMAQRFDPASLKLEGEPVSVAEDVANNENTGRAAFAVSANGVLVYRAGTRNGMTQLTWYDRDGKKLATVGEPDRYNYALLSPDEKRVALSRSESKKPVANIWVMELANGVTTRLTFDADKYNGDPVWSRDSQRIAFGSYPKSELSEVTVATAVRSTLVADPNIPGPEDWTPDGRYLAWTDRYNKKLWLFSLADRKSQAVFETQFQKFDFQFSPDGRWVAYLAKPADAWELYVAAYPSLAEVRKITNGGASNHIWRRGTNELYYVGADKRLWVAEIKGGDKLDAIIPKPLFPVRTTAAMKEVSVTADGKRFLINEEHPTGEQQIMVAVHWDAELKK